MQVTHRFDAFFFSSMFIYVAFTRYYILKILFIIALRLIGGCYGI